MSSDKFSNLTEIVLRSVSLQSSLHEDQVLVLDYLKKK